MLESVVRRAGWTVAAVAALVGAPAARGGQEAAGSEPAAVVVGSQQPAAEGSPSGVEPGPGARAPESLPWAGVEGLVSVEVWSSAQLERQARTGAPLDLVGLANRLERFELTLGRMELARLEGRDPGDVEGLHAALTVNLDARLAAASAERLEDLIGRSALLVARTRVAAGDPEGALERLNWPIELRPEGQPEDLLQRVSGYLESPYLLLSHAPSPTVLALAERLFRSPGVARERADLRARLGRGGADGWLDGSLAPEVAVWLRGRFGALDEELFDEVRNRVGNRQRSSQPQPAPVWELPYLLAFVGQRDLVRTNLLWGTDVVVGTLGEVASADPEAFCEFDLRMVGRFGTVWDDLAVRTLDKLLSTGGAAPELTPVLGRLLSVDRLRRDQTLAEVMGNFIRRGSIADPEAREAIVAACLGRPAEDVAWILRRFVALLDPPSARVSMRGHERALLPPLFDHPDPQARVGAAAWFVRSYEPGRPLTPVLELVGRDAVEERRWVLAALETVFDMQRGRDWSEPLLDAALRLVADPDDGLRADTVAFLLGARGPQPRALPLGLVEAALPRATVGERRALLGTVLAYYGSFEIALATGLEIVRLFVDDPAPEVRIELLTHDHVRSGKLAGGAPEALWRASYLALADDPSAEVRQAIDEWLGLLQGWPSVWLEVFERRAADQNDPLRLEECGRRGHERLSSLVVEASRATRERVARLALTHEDRTLGAAVLDPLAIGLPRKWDLNPDAEEVAALEDASALFGALEWRERRWLLTCVSETAFGGDTREIYARALRACPDRARVALDLVLDPATDLGLAVHAAYELDPSDPATSDAVLGVVDRALGAGDRNLNLQWARPHAPNATLVRLLERHLRRIDDPTTLDLLRKCEAWLDPVADGAADAAYTVLRFECLQPVPLDVFDPQELVTALRAAGETPQAVEAAVAALGDGSFTSRKAVEVLASLRWPALVEPLGRLVTRSSHAECAASAVAGLRSFPDSEPARAALEGALLSEWAQVRQSAAEVLENWALLRRTAGVGGGLPSEEQAAAELFALLEDEDPVLRAEAAKGLATLGRGEAIPRLIRMLAAETDAGVRVAVRGALDRLNRASEGALEEPDPSGDR